MVKAPLLKIKPSFIKYVIEFFLLLKIKLFFLIAKSFYILYTQVLLILRYLNTSI
jgi:hypothetical protein